MTNASNNLRKAAVLIRSVDADTAAKLLAQLAPEEASELRSAIRSLGAVDPEEQADVAAEFRRITPLANQPASLGVELHLTSDAGYELDAPAVRLQHGAKRFDFLDEATVEALGQFLVREHVQTIAVVLSYLAPQRAAAVLAALPDALQAETIERLSALGETDPDSLAVVERELSTWLSKRAATRAGRARRGDTVMSILAAADESTRDQILVSLKTHKASLAKQLAPLLPASRGRDDVARPASPRNMQAEGLGTRDWGLGKKPLDKTLTNLPKPLPSPSNSPAPSPQPPAPRPSFNDVALLSGAELAAVLREVDPSVLVLALAGSDDELVDRICEPMPRRTAKAFRRQLGRLGPTRLSDVEAAQRIVATAAARRIAERKRRILTSTP